MSVEVATLVVVVGICVGAVSALFGIGGGIVMVPFIVLFLDRTQHLAEGTSLLVIVPTAIAGVYAHRKARYVTVRDALAIGLPGAAGAFLGARGALLLEGPDLQKLFAALLAIVGLRLILQARRENTVTVA